uniref:Exocyst complex component 1-like n=1 Tax=Dromaius novaehollandiae TaxID=8790 RepID=A0A8C4J2T4_DRONO|nr:exocyst complex component 1-like [Dromaius novaehollandiae]XP_025954706.1 exocyst complex component 1-like [Dromaius novaehollandiae]XP_025954715.1 exocyst complex component 1-like [Dromaius novaehollandiae]
MTSLWTSLEKDVFNPQNKRLLETVRVWKTGKKKKMSILCIVVDAFRPMKPFLVKVKVDRGEQYKTANRWPLAELKLVDGKTLNQASLDFDLQFDKVYKWTASSFDEKKAFIRCLWKLNHRFLSSCITFVNVPACTVEGRQRHQEDRKDTAETESQEELSAYQEMTPKEAADMLRLMEEYEPIVNNSVAFAEQLSNDLHVLDEANLRAIISSENQVTQLMHSIDEALEEVARVEDTLQVYDELLGSVKQQMDHIYQENSLLHHIISNKTRLMDEILFLTTHLDLSKEHCEALSQGDLSSPSRIKACIAAAEALSGCMNIQIQPGYRKLQSVAEQLIMFETLKQNFENSFISHVTNIFELQGNTQVPALVHHVDKLVAPSHRLHHEELVHYIPLMAWLRNANPVLFCDLPKVYTQNLGRLYDREIKAFFEQAKILLLGRRKTSLQEVLDKPMVTGSKQQSRLSLPESRDGQEDIPNRGNVIKILEQVLKELQPLCTAEQQFIEKFFLLSQDAADPEVLEASAAKGGESMPSPEDSPCTKPRSQLDEPTTRLLSEIFSSLEPDLRGFLDICNKVHPFSCLQVLVTLNDSVFKMWGSSPSLPSSFLNTVLGNMLLLAKSSFNKCIAALCKEIEEAKVTSKTKGGILPFVSRFEEFVNFSEDVFRSAQRRGELDKAQLRLAGSVFSSINSLSSANLKANTDMIMMENFHHIHCFLCQKKIRCLEGKKREAKQRYSQHLEKYVIKYLGQPLEKLNHFFEGVKARVAQGVKEEEVSFHLAYSKQELRKVIEKYPGKEVKRALETLYRKIHKYLSPEENLLPVVWHAMEQEFIRQYQEFEDLIQRCYAGSGITMDFTMEDLLSYFNSITLSSI